MSNGILLIVAGVYLLVGLLSGTWIGVDTVCREAGYYNTLKSCEGVTYPKEEKDD